MLLSLDMDYLQNIPCYEYQMIGVQNVQVLSVPTIVTERMPEDVKGPKHICSVARIDYTICVPISLYICYGLLGER